MMINSTVTSLNANIIHMMKEHKFDTTSIVRFPMYCDIQPPTKKAMMQPRDDTAPKVMSLKWKAFTSKLLTYTNP